MGRHPEQPDRIPVGRHPEQPERMPVGRRPEQPDRMLVGRLPEQPDTADIEDNFPESMSNYKEFNQYWSQRKQQQQQQQAVATRQTVTQHCSYVQYATMRMHSTLWV